MISRKTSILKQVVSARPYKIDSLIYPVGIRFINNMYNLFYNENPKQDFFLFFFFGEN